MGKGRGVDAYRAAFEAIPEERQMIFNAVLSPMSRWRAFPLTVAIGTLPAAPGSMWSPSLALHSTLQPTSAKTALKKGTPASTPLDLQYLEMCFEPLYIVKKGEKKEKKRGRGRRKEKSDQKSKKFRSYIEMPCVQGCSFFRFSNNCTAIVKRWNIFVDPSPLKKKKGKRLAERSLFSILKYRVHVLVYIIHALCVSLPALVVSNVLEAPRCKEPT